MDLRVYYRKIREIESTIPGLYVVLVSLATTDGGRAGVLTETTRELAARQIAEGRARLAVEEEEIAFHSDNAERRRAVEQAEQMNRVQFVMLPPERATKKAKE